MQENIWQLYQGRRVDVVYCKIGVCCSCCSVAVQNMVYEKSKVKFYIYISIYRYIEYFWENDGEKKLLQQLQHCNICNTATSALTENSKGIPQSEEGNMPILYHICCRISKEYAVVNPSGILSKMLGMCQFVQENMCQPYQKRAKTCQSISV